MAAMELPAGTAVIIVGWGIALFVLWNLHRFGKAFDRSFFWKTAAALTLAAVAVFSGLFFTHGRRAVAPPRVLIFPFVEKSSVSGTIAPWGLAFADLLTAALQQRRTREFYPLPTAAVFSFAHFDSLPYSDYVRRFAHGLHLPGIGFGTYTREGAGILVEFQLLDLPEGEPVLQSAFTIEDTTKIAAAAQELGDKVAAYFELAPARARPSLAVALLPAPQQSAYYSAYLNLLQRRLEPAAKQARDLVLQDTTQPHFIALAARVRMQQLRQERAQETEWKSALAKLTPQLHSAARRDSLEAATMLLLGECLLQSKKWREAESALRRARALDPALAKVYVDMAQLHASRFAQDGFKNELELYQHALKLNPLELEAVLGAVEYYLHENHRPEALALLEKYRQLNPSHLPTLMALGRIYIEKGDMIHILPLFETILQLDPQNLEAFYNLGIAYYHQNELDSAVRFFERVLQIADYADAHTYLAQIYMQRGDTTAAIQHLRARIRLSNGSDEVYAIEARQRLYRMLLSRGEIPESLLPDTVRTR